VTIDNEKPINIRTTRDLQKRDREHTNAGSLLIRDGNNAYFYFEWPASNPRVFPVVHLNQNRNLLAEEVHCMYRTKHCRAIIQSCFTTLLL
jgi:hypothetical protein